MRGAPSGIVLRASLHSVLGVLVVFETDPLNLDVIAVTVVRLRHVNQSRHLELPLRKRMLKNIFKIRGNVKGGVGVET